MAKKLGVVIGLTLVFGMFVVGAGGATTTGYQDLPGWHWVAGGTIRGASFINSTSGWAVGDGGLIIHSSNGGVTWRPLASGTNANLRDVQFLDDNHGWVVGDADTILVTDDGGSTWSNQSVPPSGNLYGVHFINSAYGWVVGDGGTILTTQNGGLVWTSQTSKTTNDLYGVDFVNSAHGWAVGANGTVVATTDGGLNWNVQSSCTETHALYDVDFVDQNNGWMVGMGSALWTTDNGGSSWTEWYISGWTRDLFSVEFTDVNHGWAAGAAGFVAKYDGSSWTEQVSNVDVNLYDLDFVDGLRGFAVGEAGTVLSTADGGATWVSRIWSTQNEFNGFDFIDENHGWAAVGGSVSGFPGELLHTSDGGATWNVQKSGVPYLNDVQFVTDHLGWAAGGIYGDGTILATIDGGIHWVTQTLPITGPMRAVHFVSPDDGWAVGGAAGGNGWILNTTNGGNNWTLQKYLYGSGCLYDVCFSDFTHGWAVGVDGSIWATEDGGTSWDTQTSGITETLTSIYCQGRLGWTVGGSTILATQDGGNPWFVQDSSHPNATFLDVDFNGPGWGWVVGMDNSSSESLILVTGDQGNTWLPEELPYNAGLLRSVHAYRWGRGPIIWAGGANGVFLSNLPDPTAPVSGTVTPAEGGAIFSSDGRTSLIFPSGAVTTTVAITYTPKMASQAPSTGDLSGFYIFDLTAVYSGTTNLADFSGAYYTITVDYSGTVVAEDSRLGLYHWNNSEWIKEPTSSADFDQDLVTANPDHFSYFALLGKSYSIFLPVVLKIYP
jgi:photosystem II stability/assembly factor-like uncharacterized protein